MNFCCGFVRAQVESGGGQPQALTRRGRAPDGPTSRGAGAAPPWPPRYILPVQSPRRWGVGR